MGILVKALSHKWGCLTKASSVTSELMPQQAYGGGPRNVVNGLSGGGSTLLGTA